MVQSANNKIENEEIIITGEVGELTEEEKNNISLILLKMNKLQLKNDKNLIHKEGIIKKLQSIFNKNYEYLKDIFEKLAILIPDVSYKYLYSLNNLIEIFEKNLNNKKDIYDLLMSIFEIANSKEGIEKNNLDNIFKKATAFHEDKNFNNLIKEVVNKEKEIFNLPERHVFHPWFNGGFNFDNRNLVSIFRYLDNKYGFSKNEISLYFCHTDCILPLNKIKSIAKKILSLNEGDEDIKFRLKFIFSEKNISSFQDPLDGCYDDKYECIMLLLDTDIENLRCIEKHGGDLCSLHNNNYKNPEDGYRIIKKIALIKNKETFDCIFGFRLLRTHNSNIEIQELLFSIILEKNKSNKLYEDSLRENVFNTPFNIASLNSNLQLPDIENICEDNNIGIEEQVEKIKKLFPKEVVEIEKEKKAQEIKRLENEAKKPTEKERKLIMDLIKKETHIKEVAIKVYNELICLLQEYVMDNQKDKENVNKIYELLNEFDYSTELSKFIQDFIKNKILIYLEKHILDPFNNLNSQLIQELILALTNKSFMPKPMAKKRKFAEYEN